MEIWCGDGKGRGCRWRISGRSDVMGGYGVGLGPRICTWNESKGQLDITGEGGQGGDERSGKRLEIAMDAVVGVVNIATA